jgi:hypothetical protein
VIKIIKIHNLKNEEINMIDEFEINKLYYIDSYNEIDDNDNDDNDNYNNKVYTHCIFKQNTIIYIPQINNNNYINIYFEDFIDAFNYNFIIDKQYKLYDNGYSGYYIEYHIPDINDNIDTNIYIQNRTKKVKCEYYHNNGKIEGKYKEYDIFGHIIKDIDYCNGKIHRLYISSYDNSRYMPKKNK